MPPKKKVEVEIAPLNASITKELVADPLDDKELRAVLGNHAKIVPYHKLSEYSSIDELLPKPKDAVVLLYENRPMDGHWVAITKNKGEISFFDPYGEVIDKQLKYSNYSNQRVQGEGDTSLHNLLSTSKLPVYFNDYKYQRDGGGVNTCGRHVANFIRYNLDEGLDLEDYNEMMMKTQKETGLPYDELIVQMLPIHIPHPDDAMRQASSADIAQQRGLGGARPRDPSLWEEVKAYTRTRFPKWSAYASGFASKLYKERGGEWEDDGEGRPLKRWFKEKWEDVGGKDYPVFRPTKRISKDTPLTASEVSPANLRKQTALKQRIKGDKNLPPFMEGGRRPPLTPVEKVGNNYLKRDDLFQYAGQRGGKVRSALYLIKKANEKCLTTAGNRNSPQINIVSSIGKKLGKPVVAFTSTGELGREVKLAKEKGADIKQVRPGYETVITRRAKDYAEKNGCAYIPFGMDTPDVHFLTAEQVKNIPSNVKRIVIPVGSASSIIGVIKGVMEHKKGVKVLGVVVGANPLKKLDKYVPNWRSVASLVFPKLKYHEPAKETNFNGVDLDPYYEAKTLPYIKLGDLLWVVGVREGLDAEGGADKGHEGTDAVKLPRPTFKNPLVVAKKSKVKGGGWGLFAKVDIPKGERIADFYGEEMDWSDFTKKFGEYKGRADLHQFAYLSRRTGKIILSVEEPYLSKNVVNYINEIPPNFNVELRQKGLWAIKDIPKGEELSLEYPEAYDRYWLR